MSRTIGQVITYLKATPEESWMTEKVADSNGKKFCCLGHVFSMGKNDKEGNDWWNWFEYNVATEYMVFPVNDGRNPKYQQATPKARVIAYLKDIKAGKQKATWQLMEEM